MIRNELIGFYRKRNKKDAAYKNIEEAFKLIAALDFESTVSAGTTYTNAATAYYTFEEYAPSLIFFEKARRIYEANEHTGPSLLGGLYNNMALSCAALKKVEQAIDLYKALAAMEAVPGGILEQAITCLNLANALEAQKAWNRLKRKSFNCWTGQKIRWKALNL